MRELKQLLLLAPKGHIDPIAMKTIKEWDKNPKAIQILKTLDMCVHSGLASSFVIHVLEQMFNKALKKEKTTYEEVVKEATWRQS
jgi:galactokinase/mevalonate kinase-like predicted kinase